MALDCEMVGVEGGESMLARVVLVNSYGHLIYDKYVLPQETVLNLRTRWSGIREHHLHPNLGRLIPNFWQGKKKLNVLFFVD